MTQKKKAKKQPQPEDAPSQRAPIFAPQFKEDLGWWYKTDKTKVDRIFDLVTDVMAHPLEGIGKPEPLKYVEPNTWSRRIDQEHRLLYRVLHDRIQFLQARYHY